MNIPYIFWRPEIERSIMPRSANRQTLRVHIDRMVQRIVAKFRPEQVILFGSHARGEAGPDSDVDLLVEIREEWV
jgi:predicted nucleotidyltransferase